MKPTIYVANVSDDDYAKGNSLSDRVLEYAKKDGSRAVVVSAQVESELMAMALPPEEQSKYMVALGFDENSSSGLKLLTNQAYEALGLQTFFTAGTLMGYIKLNSLLRLSITIGFCLLFRNRPHRDQGVDD
jgi:ribosome-binding ATPase YchF (GTP1/OBG family)